MYLTQCLHRSVQQHPDRTAVRFGARRRTFAEFAEFADRVARLAGALRSPGLATGDHTRDLKSSPEFHHEP